LVQFTGIIGAITGAGGIGSDVGESISTSKSSSDWALVYSWSLEEEPAGEGVLFILLVDYSGEIMLITRT